MKRRCLILLPLLTLSANPALSAERTVTLAVENMTCVSCPYIVRKTLAAVPGVSDVRVSYEDGSAVVTFDDANTTVDALTEATARRGYPSQIRMEQEGG
ncbi:mercury resistance system periplasmic binding protein MerP [Lutibaculum baratangense]|uniref:Periplasmic mercury ion-binding protein n=1 Tax=Lutibaculum baratangense AMV1 TaxID=631454 RepID=V4QXY8_9HYPH|nr:mercury resistance system periplasmic binding protein MerP [Lutibaculum baratangense]ESR24617.1 Periplasmic mercury(+2) binding protein [Lutibaculum baratangense AMV1]